MRKGYIIKIDYKEGDLRLDLYKAHSVRIAGRCKVDFDMGLKVSQMRSKIDILVMQMDKEFEIGFNSNSAKNIRHWIKANIDVLHIRNDIDDDVAFELQKLASDKCILIRD